MSEKYLVSHHLFSNRLYISDIQSEQELKDNVFGPKKKVTSASGEKSYHVIPKNIWGLRFEREGAGVRCYNSFFGWILSLLGRASKIHVGDRDFYLNNNSVTKFVLRSLEMHAPSSAIDAATQLDELYLKHQETGYDKNTLNKANNELKRLLANDPKMGIKTLFVELQKSVKTQKA